MTRDYQSYAYDYVTTDQLNEGDTVTEHGMVLILGPNVSKQEGVWRFYGQVQNPDEVTDGLIWGLLHKSYWSGDRWEVEYSGVWTVQGNTLAHVVRRTPLDREAEVAKIIHLLRPMSE